MPTRKTGTVGSKKRDVGPVTVLKTEDLVKLDTLEERTNALLENRYEIFMHNVTFLCKKHGISQAKLCTDKLNNLIQPPQLTSYKKYGKDIPLSAIAMVASAFNLTIEEICGQILEECGQNSDGDSAEQGRSREEYEKYLGLYDVAYFDTSKPLGANFLPTANSLSNALLVVYEECNALGIASFHVAALMNCTDEERDKVAGLIERLNLKNAGKAVYDCCESVVSNTNASRAKCLYKGNIYLTEQMVEITLHQVKGSNVIHLLAHNRAAGSSEGKNYKGGLTTMLSVSRGAEHMPCIQAALLMSGTHTEVWDENNKPRTCPKNRLRYFPEEQLAHKLYMAPPAIEFDQETKEIVAFMRLLFSEGEHSALTALSDEDKRCCLENFAERKLTNALKRNILSYYKISVQMDSDVYRMICQS